MTLEKWTWRKDIVAEISDEVGDALVREQQGRGYVGVAEATFDTEQVISACEQDLNFFAALLMPTVFSVFYPPVLLATWALLRRSIVEPKQSDPKLALGIPRGHAKTTILKLFVMWCILFSKKKFILVTCATQNLAVNIVADIEDMLNEPNIIAVFGDWKRGIEVNRQDLKKFNFRGRAIIIAAMGAEGSLRGLNIKNERPDVMLFDDIQTRECADSKQQSELLERWMVGTAMKAKSPHGCLFIFAGNMYPTQYSILRKLKDNPTWTKFISGAILADGTALWPALRPMKSLIEELNNDISMGHPGVFFAEVLNDVEAGTNTRTDLSLIRDWPWRADEIPQGRFIIIDPSANKTGGDDVSIGQFDVYDHIPALREVIEKNISPGDTIREALAMAVRTKTKVIAVESTAYQYSLLYWFQFICEQLNITGLHFVEIYTGNYSKNARITDMLKTMTAGEIILHPSVKSIVVSQISHWNPMKRNNTDGILDLLAHAPRCIELYSNIMSVEEDLYLKDAMSSGVVSNNFMF